MSLRTPDPLSVFRGRGLGTRLDFRILEWISGFQNGFLYFHSGFLYFTVDFWISQWISANGVRDFLRDGPLDWLQSSMVASDGGHCICIYSPHCRGDIPLLEGTQGTAFVWCLAMTSVWLQFVFDKYIEYAEKIKYRSLAKKAHGRSTLQVCQRGGWALF